MCKAGKRISGERCVAEMNDKPVVRDGFLITFNGHPQASRTTLFVQTYEDLLSHIKTMSALKYTNIQIWQALAVPADHPAATTGNSKLDVKGIAK